MGNRIRLINCYFGTLPNYFPLWVRSCAANSRVDFLLVTDAEIPCPLPPNVSVERVGWEELLRRFQDAFPFRLAIESPYKLTDLKPAYGYLFEPELRGYDYWGYCDVDLIFGDLMKFLEGPLSEGYEKIYRLGHLTLYRNTERMRELFRQRGGMFSYREVFSRPAFYSFDEHAGQMLIAKRQGVRSYEREDMADISCRIRRMTASRQENYPQQVFYYENGAVYRAYVKDGAVRTEEFVYIHIQKRRYRFDGDFERFYILGDRFAPKAPGQPSADEILRLSGYVDDETDRAQLKAYRDEKKKHFLSCPLREKRIWLLQKLAEHRFE